jgi:adenosine deaminase
MISPVTQETFNKMEDVYTYRGPFTKNKTLFPEYLKCIADDYKRTGIDYAELSFSAFLTDAEYMQMLEDNLPKIEQETGVKLRFLAGIWRHSDQEWNLDDTDRLMRVAKSPYIVGCDFMGHETNPTLDFEEELKMLSRYATQEDPNFAIRIHAGENPMFKSNVYDALKVIYDEHSQVEQESGKKMPMPQVRIGHGLYGLDITEDGKWNKVEPGGVLKLAKEMGAIVEFNMSSNLALNNINDISEIPIKKYLDYDIDVVLGTDGHGMYSTFGGQEALLATAAGLETSDFEKIKATESKVMSKAKKRESEHPRITDVPALYSNMAYSTPDGNPRYTKEVEEKYQIQKQNASKYLGEKIAHTGAVTDEKTIEEDTRDKIPIMISGASKKSWPNILPKDQENIRLTMQVLANTLNPETSYVVTGGTNFGAEQTMHEAVHRRNSKSEKPLVLLGTFTMEAALEGEKGVEPDTITHATVLELDGRKANNWMDLPDTQLEYVKERNGYMIAIGGGPVVSDMIQRAHNLGVDMHLMDGPYGASTDKSKSLKGNDYSFSTIPQLLQRLYEKNPQLFNKDFSLDKVETYIAQAQQELEQQKICDNPANFGLGAIDQIYQTITYQEKSNGKQKLEQAINENERNQDVSEVSL